MPVALFIASGNTGHREIQSVVASFAAAGWTVDVVVGWAGAGAAQAVEEYGKIARNVFRPLPLHRYPGEHGQRDPDGPDDPAEIRRVVAYEAQLFETVKDPQVDGFYLLNTLMLHLENPPENLQAETRRLLAESPLAKRFQVMCHGFRNMRLLRAWADDVVRRSAPDVMFCPAHHSCGNIDDCLGWAARRRGVATVSLPTTPQVGSEFQIRSQFELFKLGTYPQQRRADFDALTYACTRLHPEWTQEKDGLKLFMFEPEGMVIADALGLLQPDVWQKPSSLYDIAFVNSPLSVKMLEVSGFPVDKVTVSGFSMLDRVLPGLRDPDHDAGVWRRLGLTPGQPFILFAVENGAEHSLVSWDVHWERFRRLMTAVTAAGTPVVASLHPTCDPAKYMFAEQEFGVRIALEDRIHELFPRCAAAVSYPSSVNLMAEAFDKPLLIYDWYDFLNPAKGIGWMYEVPGAKVAADPEELARLIPPALAETAGRNRDYSAMRRPSDVILETVERFLKQRTAMR